MQQSLKTGIAQNLTELLKKFLTEIQNALPTDSHNLPKTTTKQKVLDALDALPNNTRARSTTF